MYKKSSFEFIVEGSYFELKSFKSAKVSRNKLKSLKKIVLIILYMER